MIIVIESITIIINDTKDNNSNTNMNTSIQKGTNGVSTSGVAANFMVFDGLFGYSR